MCDPTESRAAQGPDAGADDGTIRLGGCSGGAQVEEMVKPPTREAAEQEPKGQEARPAGRCVHVGERLVIPPRDYASHVG